MPAMVPISDEERIPDRPAASEMGFRLGCRRAAAAYEFAEPASAAFRVSRAADLRRRLSRA